MNVFQALYCNQYFELKPKGREAEGRSYGTRLLTITIGLNIITLVVLAMVVSADFTDAFADTVTDFFGRRSGRSVGQLLALIPFLIALPIVRYTLGRKQSYKALISRFEVLSAERQKQVSQRGLYYFKASLIIFLIAVVLVFLFLV